MMVLKLFLHVCVLQVDAVRSQCNDRINKLTSEVHALEMVSYFSHASLFSCDAHVFLFTEE